MRFNDFNMVLKYLMYVVVDANTMTRLRLKKIAALHLPFSTLHQDSCSCVLFPWLSWF